jgi:hypothetical protein
MVNVNTVFPTKYVKAQDINGQVQVTIRAAVMEQLGDEHKLVVYFDGHEKGMVLNKTNANNLSNLYGPESDGWIGKSMMLVSTFVDFQGQSTPALRLHPPQQQPAQQPAQQTTPMGEVKYEQVVPSTGIHQQVGSEYTEANPPPQGNPIDDDIPF